MEPYVRPDFGPTIHNTERMSTKESMSTKEPSKAHGEGFKGQGAMNTTELQTPFFFRGPEDHMYIRILQSGSRA